MDPWDRLFAEKASLIISRRDDFIKRFNDIFISAYRRIATDDDCPGIRYLSSTGLSDFERIYGKLIERRLKDIISGSCGIGPHRDDFLIEHSEGTLFSNYASQGQRRTAAIALKIAECEIIEERLDKKAVILVDDIFSELDENRRKKMVSILSSGNQVIFTMVNINSVDKGVFQSSMHYEVKGNGTVFLV